jgi:hypothetical protein
MYALVLLGDVEGSNLFVKKTYTNLQKIWMMASVVSIIVVGSSH